MLNYYYLFHFHTATMLFSLSSMLINTMASLELSFASSSLMQVSLALLASIRSLDAEIRVLALKSVFFRVICRQLGLVLHIKSASNEKLCCFRGTKLDVTLTAMQTYKT